MRLRVTFTVDADNELRDAVGSYYGVGRASFDEVREFFAARGTDGWMILADEDLLAKKAQEAIDDEQ